MRRGIYDLFAIRVIIDTPPEREKADCWMAYSIVTDMYKPNPARMSPAASSRDLTGAMKSAM